MEKYIVIWIITSYFLPAVNIATPRSKMKLYRLWAINIIQVTSSVQDAVIRSEQQPLLLFATSIHGARDVTRINTLLNVLSVANLS